MDGQSGRPGNGPASVNSYTGPFQAGLIWGVTAGGFWLQGYRFWVPPNGDTGAQTFALWQLTDTAHGVTDILVPFSAVTSGTLNAGAWNFVPLTTPIALSAGVPYVAVTGWEASAGFPDTQNYFGAGDTFAAGITNGVLFAYSDQGASNPEPFTSNLHQGLFGTGSASSASASANFPATADVHSNFWIDIQVSDGAPSGAVYRLWPSQPYAIGWNLDTANNFTLGTQFQVSQLCKLTKIWFYSPAGVTQLPTECAIFTDSTQTVLAGSDNASPVWKDPSGSNASPGDGWVYCDYSAASVLLAASTSYKAVVVNGAASPAAWSAQTASYWAGAGPGASGVSNGPMSAPGNAAADSPGQSSYHAGAALHWPDTNTGPYNYWVDPEVQPASAPAGHGPSQGSVSRGGALSAAAVAAFAGDRAAVTPAAVSSAAVTPS